MAAGSVFNDLHKHRRGSCEDFTSSYQQNSLAQSSMVMLYEELGLLRAKYQLLVEQCNCLLKPHSIVDSTKRSVVQSKVLKSTSNFITPTSVESPEQQRDLKLLEEVLEKARKIRISQPIDQPQRTIRRTENTVKLAETVYKPAKKASDSHRLPSSGSQGHAKATVQKRHSQHTSAAVRKHKPPSSSTSKRKCHNHAQPPLHAFPRSQQPTVVHHHQTERKREDMDVLETVVVRHAETKKESPQLKPLPVKYRRLQQMMERTNGVFKAKQDNREDDSIADHFFSRFKVSSDHSEQHIQLLIAREEHRLVAQELSSLILHDLIASERQCLEEVMKMRTRLEKLTAPLDILLLHEAMQRMKENTSCQSVCQPYSNLKQCRAVLALRLSELWLRFETEFLCFCSQHVLPQLTRMDVHDLRFLSLLKLTHRLCCLSPPVFISTDFQ